MTTVNTTSPKTEPPALDEMMERVGSALSDVLCDLEQVLQNLRHDQQYLASFARDRYEVLGRVVREAWVAWAKTQPNPKPSWLVPWSQLSEPDREVDRRIGAAVARYLGDDRRIAWDRGWAAGKTEGQPGQDGRPQFHTNPYEEEEYGL